MKIVYVGPLNSEGAAYQRKIALEELGHDVTAHSWLSEGMQYYDRPSLLERVSWKIGFPLDSTKVNNAILSSIAQKHPDILWIDKGSTIWPRTLRVTKELSPTTQIVSYLPDDMLAAPHRSSFFKRGIRYYDYIFTSNSHNWRANELPSLEQSVYYSSILPMIHIYIGPFLSATMMQKHSAQTSGSSGRMNGNERIVCCF